MTTNSKRLRALDILRGITIAGMITVNNPGSWSHMFAPLDHAQWIGLTPTDLVFPFFMFIMGISTCFSLKKYNYTLTRQSLYKILKRVVLLYLIGLAICIIAMLAFKGTFDFDKLRLTGVLARLAICYGITAVLASTIRHKFFPLIITALLVIYYIILVTGNGFTQDTSNILSKVDCNVLGGHMYNDHGIDPEGILSTIPSVAHVMIGFYTGRLFMQPCDLDKKLLQLLLGGTIGIFTGYLLSYGCPISKKIWSPTFVLVTCGAAASFLALLIWIVDVKGWKRGVIFFESIGINPLFCFVLGDMFSIFFAMHLPSLGFPDGLQSLLMKTVFNPLFGGGEWSSLLYALMITAFVWGIAHILYKKQIYIKL